MEFRRKLENGIQLVLRGSEWYRDGVTYWDKATAAEVEMAAVINEHLHRRRCFQCKNEDWHKDSVVPYVLCRKCGSQDTRKIKA